MNYVCDITIHKPIEEVFRSFTNYDEMPLWQKGLSRIEHLGDIHQKGSVSKLFFDIEGQTMMMKESLEAYVFPSVFTAIYEVEGAWNKCINHFNAKGNDTQWTMESTFKFKQENNIPQSAFEQKTLTAMKLFKHYIEHK